MEWDEYKKICDHPSVLTRWLIEQTVRVCDADTASLLDSILESEPIAKPPGHKGGDAIAMFNTSLNREVIAHIVEQVQHAVKTKKKTIGHFVRDYSHIEKTWLEYLNWCHEVASSEDESGKQDTSKWPL